MPIPATLTHTSGILTPLDNFACRDLYQVYTGYRLTRGFYLVYLLARRSYCRRAIDAKLSSQQGSWTIWASEVTIFLGISPV